MGRIVPDCLAYSDESSYTEGRYRSISLVSLRYGCFENIRNMLIEILYESGISEFKWKKLRGAKYRFGALKIIDYIIPECIIGNVRIDTLIWDTYDRRHNVFGRDDIANLNRMYYQLLKNVFNMRWPPDKRWYFYPDKTSAMDWFTLGECITKATHGTKLIDTDHLFTPDTAAVTFRIRRLIPCDSCDEPFIQVADLFAGMAVYSRICYDRYQQWKELSSGQLSMFEREDIPSSGDVYRCEVLEHLYTTSREYGMSVELDISNGLWTRNPDHPINLWLYKSTYAKDTAPVREDKR